MSYTEGEFTLVDREWARRDDLRLARLRAEAEAKAEELAEDLKTERDDTLDPEED